MRWEMRERLLCVLFKKLLSCGGWRVQKWQNTKESKKSSLSQHRQTENMLPGRRWMRTLFFVFSVQPPTFSFLKFSLNAHNNNDFSYVFNLFKSAPAFYKTDLVLVMQAMQRVKPLMFFVVVAVLNVASRSSLCSWSLWMDWEPSTCSRGAISSPFWTNSVSVAHILLCSAVWLHISVFVVGHSRPSSLWRPQRIMWLSV